MLRSCMDLLNKYLNGCSPYIIALNYDLEKREFIVVCAKSISDWTKGKQIKFIDVIGFTEIAFEELIDDDLIDSVMGLHQTQNGHYCLHTEKRELTIHTLKTPISESN